MNMLFCCLGLSARLRQRQTDGRASRTSLAARCRGEKPLTRTGNEDNLDAEHVGQKFWETLGKSIPSRATATASTARTIASARADDGKRMQVIASEGQNAAHFSAGLGASWPAKF